MAFQPQLPQMKSIWIDEDQEAEKLYGTHAHTLLNSDDEDQLDFILINSNRPVLSNKKKIELPPLLPAAYKSKTKNSGLKQTANVQAKNSKKNAFLKLFKSKDFRSESSGPKISVPFDFQHISHADMRVTCEEAPPHDALRKEEPVVTLNKAFVTESLPAAVPNQDRTKSVASKYDLVRRSLSVSSSQYSSSSGRILSTSTMATQVVEEHIKGPRRLSEKQKVQLRVGQGQGQSQRQEYENSDRNSVSAEFLKEYQFPTVLEEFSLLSFKTPDISTQQVERFTWETPENYRGESDGLQNGAFPSPKFTPRRGSDSQLLASSLQKASPILDTPRTRKSLDDILLCYHLNSQNSEAGSNSVKCENTEPTPTIDCHDEKLISPA
ncbi:LAMI_0H03312g1_1 [Lachancea mirantina]|uniref:LAMI_0H03312g1_1 n=1 Tax=Lachancea mirantina TaxID=1230905 RepID=A0A1G4KEE8_9SACH|nr:LAMI_0H03312g1_1 [Lachancea mirantina]